MKSTRLTFPILFIASAALFAVLAFVTDGVEGKTITVDDDGGADYEKIQDAINASEDGDTVRVWGGVYEENVVVNKSIDLIGDGREITIIDASGYGDVVQITADWVNMSGFSVTGSGYSGYPDFDAGIKVESNHCRIFNNTCENNKDGIALRDSSGCTTTDNTCSENSDHGIYLYSSRYCTLTNNTCSENNKYGIYLYSSRACTIENNRCSLNNVCGIYLFISYDSKITNNTCSENNDHGIRLQSSSECTIENNTMNENGISIRGFLEDWDSHTIDTTNTVNGKPVYYYKNAAGFTVPYGAGQVILANCTRITVENQNCSNGSVGILVGYSFYVTLDNNTCKNNSNGIELFESRDNTISNNTISRNKNGIFLSSSSECTIENNICESNNDDGIYLWNSDECKIKKNTCSANDRNGIYLQDSSDCTITNNTCPSNRGGIQLFNADDCTIENNTCSSNRRGIILFLADDNIITNNTILGNRVGIYLAFTSRDNTAHYNSIYNNTEYGIDASGNYDCTINATDNWWGNEAGPHHLNENPDGTGDNVTDHVEFGPWLKEPAISDNGKPADEENDTDTFQNLCLSSLLLILVSLLVLLVITVNLSGKHLAKNAASSTADEYSDESPPLPDIINTCPHCGGKFEVESTKRPIRFNCNFCGEMVEFK